jgi:hypothetical protein
MQHTNEHVNMDDMPHYNPWICAPMRRVNTLLERSIDWSLAALVTATCVLLVGDKLK